VKPSAIHGPWIGIVHAALPRIDYYAPYFGKVVLWNADDQTVDVQPSDPGVPSMARVPFRCGLPGVVMSVQPGTSVVIEWLNGDPSQPIASSWQGGEHVVRLTLNADQIYLGGETGAEPAAKGQTLQTYLNKLAALLTAHTHGITVDPTLSALAVTPPTIAATNAYGK
jgi:hypothetical protein